MGNSKKRSAEKKRRRIERALERKINYDVNAVVANQDIRSRPPTKHKSKKKKKCNNKSIKLDCHKSDQCYRSGQFSYERYESYKKNNSNIATIYFDKSLSYFNESLKYNPKNTKALYDKACLLIDANKLEDSLECFEKILEIDSCNMVVLGDKAGILERLGRRKEAAEVREIRKSIVPPSNVKKIEGNDIAVTDNDDFYLYMKYGKK